jgi:hypothetical protein
LPVGAFYAPNVSKLFSKAVAGKVIRIPPIWRGYLLDDAKWPSCRRSFGADEHIRLS